MNTVPGNPSGEAYPHQLDWLLDGNFREVDAQFNLASTRERALRGIDIINRAEGRFLITPPSNQESEDLVRLTLGSHAMLGVVEHREKYSLYSVPQGARLLAKTLQNAPYEAPYMRFLAARADRLLSKLESVDQNAFGVTAEQIAIGHNGENKETSDDDTFLMVVPPLAAPTTSAKLEGNERERELRQMRERARNARTSAERKLGTISIGDREFEKLKDVERADVWTWLTERHTR